jgi:hypothetical protein
MDRRTVPLALAALAALLMLAHQQVGAAPRSPTDDREVVERLPARLPGAAPRARVGTLRPAADLSTALRLARESIERARHSGDPRDWGQAQAALAPWWAAAHPPAPVRLLRATIRQAEHDFAGALADLDALLLHPAPAAPDSLRAQAELTRASLHQVQGRLAEARAGCVRLAGALYARLGSSVARPAGACLAELDHLQGRRNATQADAALAAMGPADDAWLTLLRAELAQRAGRTAQANALFRAATAGPAPGLYALAAHADWLLEQGRPAEVVALLAAYEAADALLLRLAIARHALAAAGAPGAPAHGPDVAALQARFDAALARGDRGHARERARFALDLLGDAPQALALARANWAAQREPADALLLLRAAQAAGHPEAAEPVRQWAREQGFTDRRWARIGRPTTAGGAG